MKNVKDKSTESGIYSIKDYDLGFFLQYFKNSILVDCVSSRIDPPKNTRYVEMRLNEVYPVKKSSTRLKLLSTKANTKASPPLKALVEAYNVVLNEQQLMTPLLINVVQLAYLEDWALLERDHSTSLAGAINHLESSTICLPITVVCYQFSYRRHAGNHKTCLNSAAIGAIFAATDSVCTLQVEHVLNQDETPLLYSLVFGEGVVNDATPIVLFNAIQNFDLSNISAKITMKFIGNFLELFFASTSLGVMTGLLSAYIIRKLYIGRHSTDREVALVILMAYFSYMLAELFYLSGILTVFFCGIVMSHYTWHNVTESSRITTKHAFAKLSFVAETFIFLYVGMDALDMDKWRFVHDSPGTLIDVSSILMFLVMVGRAALVFPLSFVSNLTKKAGSQKISIRQQRAIDFQGLVI
ncbi:uncharacterized protein [Phyllobates terribilis]|uniref:uncharacterized protein n=1 Tax=Phyllobates terribilis TaxID=111132 RepID=UPI003CCAD552